MESITSSGSRATTIVRAAAEHKHQTRNCPSSDVYRMDYYRKFFLKILMKLVHSPRHGIHRNPALLLHIVIFTLLLSCQRTLFVTGHSQHGSKVDLEPVFLAPLENITAAQGRDVVFTCVADNLGEYRVAWIKSDSKAILAIHTHMVALNSRLSVTHNGHNTWKLHISHVQLNDSGSYMCQINTDPMRSQSGYLDVVVPPDILSGSDGTMSDEGGIPENGTVKLSCLATGVPKPTVQWRREGGRDIILRPEGGARDNKQVVKHVDGMNLTLHHVSRTDMGAYMCIASNKVPPSVSKRFEVKVNFMPSIRAVSQLVGAPIHRQVLLQCIVEAYPQPLMGWSTNDGTKLYGSDKYQMTETMLNGYTWSMNLTIRNLQMGDFRAYLCTADNGLGSDEAIVRLQELRLPPTSTTTPVPYIPSTQKPRRKQHSQNNKNIIPEVSKPKDPFSPNLYLLENEAINPGPETPTQTPSRMGLDTKMRNTQMPAPMPTHRTSWIDNNSSSNSGPREGLLVTLSIAVIVVCRQVFKSL